MKSVTIISMIFIVLVGPANARAELRLMQLCSTAFEKMGAVRFVPVTAGRNSAIAAKYGSDSRARFLATLEKGYAKEGTGFAVGAIEPIPQALVPKDPRLAMIARRANEVLQTPDIMADFVQSTSSRAYSMRLAATSKVKPVDQKLPTDGIELLERMSAELGWGKVEVLPENENGLLGRDEFRAKVFGRDRLMFDEEGVYIPHTGSAHVLQWLMITPHLEREFGPGAAKELWRYFQREDSVELWREVFDRPANTFRNFRSPRAFSIYDLANEQHSIFGLP